MDPFQLLQAPPPQASLWQEASSGEPGAQQSSVNSAVTAEKRGCSFADAQTEERWAGHALGRETDLREA